MLTREKLHEAMNEIIIGRRVMNIGDAVKALRAGERVRRLGWNGKGMCLELQIPDESSKMTLPFVYMKTADGHLVPWLCSQTDLLADDWQLVE